MKRFSAIFAVALVVGCANPVPMSTDTMSTTSEFNMAELDALVGTWTVQFNEDASVGFEFLENDVYEVRKKNNNKYVLVVKRKMHERAAWKQHKDKEIKLKEFARTGASDYLCSDNIMLSDHPSGSNGNVKHTIAFFAKSTAGQQLVTGGHGGANTCEEWQTHGGRAHSQF